MTLTYTQTMGTAARFFTATLCAAAAILVATANGAGSVQTNAVLDRQTLPPAPPKPKVSGTRIGERVRVTYSFATWPKAADRRPVMLLTVVRSSDPRKSGLMRRHRISTRKGVVWQPLGLGGAPFRLYAAAYSRTGRSSPTVSAPVRNG